MMLDPAFIALFGTLGGGIMLKVIETYLKTEKAGSNVISAGQNYDQRWLDPDYVKMIHNTRESEAYNGMNLTECECKIHAAPTLIDIPVVRRPRTSLEIKSPIATKNWKTTIDGWQFEIPERVVPRHAYGVIERVDGHFAYGLFKWIDVTGKTKAAKVISIPKSFHAEFKPRREAMVQYQDDGTIIIEKSVVDRVRVISEQTKAGILSPNEARQELRELGL